jgi:hypothetical protein
MTLANPVDAVKPLGDNDLSAALSLANSLDKDALLNGEILLETRSHTAWGAAVAATMWLPTGRSQLWRQLTDYSRWPQYFPDIVHSEVLDHLAPHRKRLIQRAKKSFLMLTVQVEVIVNAVEFFERTVKFRLAAHDQSSFSDFTAELTLTDAGDGTTLTYMVQATPKMPVPGTLIQEAMKLDLPGNMRHMRNQLLAA